MSPDTLFWLIAVIAFVVLEASTTALVSIWFAVGGRGGAGGQFLYPVPAHGSGDLCGGFGHCAARHGAHSRQAPQGTQSSGDQRLAADHR